jgi:poly(3-hydroxybutyrate) depolymerase
MFNYNTLTSSGESRRYILRRPESYDSSHPYRLIFGFHGATGNGGQVAGNPAFFGLYALAEDSTIFVAPDAVDGLWSASRDLILIDDILEQVLNDLCIDTTRIELEGFSQGGAMVQTLACGRPGLFRAAVVHSGGGLSRPETCEPIPYFGSLGEQENGGQETQTDFFAMANGCTLETLPSAPGGGHRCSDYTGCSAEHPVRWCPYDGGHTPSPNDSGQSSSWMPEEVWAFLSQF